MSGFVGLGVLGRGKESVGNAPKPSVESSLHTFSDKTGILWHFSADSGMVGTPYLVVKVRRLLVRAWWLVRVFVVLLVIS